MEQTFTLRKTAEINDLAEMRQFVAQQAEMFNIDEATIYNLQLAITELVTNVLDYGYDGKPGVVEIELRREGDNLAVYLRDEAGHFDPTKVPGPDLTLPLNKRPVGGLGIHLTRKCIDEMSYCVLPQGGNEVKLLVNGIKGKSVS